MARPKKDTDQVDTVEVETPAEAKHDPFFVAEERGFIGVKVDPYPNEAYSLESGPASPGVVEARHAIEAFNEAEQE